MLDESSWTAIGSHLTFDCPPKIGKVMSNSSGLGVVPASDVLAVYPGSRAVIILGCLLFHYSYCQFSLNLAKLYSKSVK